MMFWIIIGIITLIAYLTFIHILHKGYVMSNPYTENDIKSVIQRGMTSLSGVSADTDPELESSLVYHINKWYERFGYDTSLEFNIDYDSDKNFNLTGENPPVYIIIMVAIFSAVRVTFFPFTLEDRGE